MTGWSARSVQGSLRKLQDARLIVSHGDSHGGRGRTTKWELLFAPDYGKPATGVGAGKGAGGAPFSDEGDTKGAGGAPFSDEGDTKGAGGAPFPGVADGERVQDETEKGAGERALIENPHRILESEPPRARARARHAESPTATDGASEPAVPDARQREFLLDLVLRDANLPPPYRYLRAELRAELDARRAAHDNPEKRAE